MPDAINPKIRLFVEASLQAGAQLPLSDEQSHYLLGVMRCAEGTPLAVFNNGQDGEWLARLTLLSRKKAGLQVVERRREPRPCPDIWYLFAPLKHGRIDYIAQKVAELGASALWPVITARTVAARVNQERLLANAIEAAEQSERTDIPRIIEPEPLEKCLASWPKDRLLLYGDETGRGLPPQRLFAQLPATSPGGWAVLVGPEGGFSPEELDRLRALPFAHALSLGPRILRADTAGLAALSCWMAWKGDWHGDS